MKIISEHFAQLNMSNKEKATFPNQPEVNPNGGPSYFDLNNVRKVNIVIPLRSDKETCTHLAE